MPLIDHLSVDVADIARARSFYDLVLAALGTGCLAADDEFATYGQRHGPLLVIQFDAHSDTWVDPDPERIDHGTFMYHAIQEGLLAPERSVQVGIRTHNSETQGFKTIDAPEVHEFGAVRAARHLFARIYSSK